jgi:hypothetical protein
VVVVAVVVGRLAHVEAVVHRQEHVGVEPWMEAVMGVSRKPFL